MPIEAEALSDETATLDDAKLAELRATFHDPVIAQGDDGRLRPAEPVPPQRRHPARVVSQVILRTRFGPGNHEPACEGIRALAGEYPSYEALLSIEPDFVDGGFNSAFDGKGGARPSRG